MITVPASPQTETVINMDMGIYFRLPLPTRVPGFFIDVPHDPYATQTDRNDIASSKRGYPVSIASSPARDYKLEEQVTRHYSYEKYVDVHSFLIEHPAVSSALVEAVPHIERAFGKGTQMVLSLSQDFDSNGEIILAVGIITPLPTREALAHLRSFNKSWWILASRGLRNKMGFDLEFI